jgi:DNA-binding NarL/FixJ family response regulator
MTVKRPYSDGPSTHVVLATHSREIKTALFLALNAIPTITIVATAASTAELISYCHSFRPDTAIVENGLPGRALGSVLHELGTSIPELRTLLIDEQDNLKDDYELIHVEVFTDLDQLISEFPEQGADAQ